MAQKRQMVKALTEKYFSTLYITLLSYPQKLSEWRRLCSISILVLLMATISACSYMPDWLGDSDKDSGIKGTRIAVLGTTSDVSTDSNLESVKVLIPHSLPNDKWYKSDGHHYLVPNNPELAHEFPKIKEISTGKGTNYDQHMSASPIIADDKVFTISADSVISAFNAHDIKQRIWQTKLNIGDKKERFSSAAGITYNNGKILATTGYSEVLSLDASSGKILWTRNINSVARSAPAAKDNAIFINTLDNKLYALDESDGGILWTHSGSSEEISMFGSASPVVYDNVVIAPYSSGEIYALKTSDGAEVWSDVFARRSLSTSGILSDIDASPVVSFGKVFVISNDGVLAASDLFANKRLWEQNISGRQSPWVAGDFLYVISDKNQLMCLHIPSGGIKWIKQFDNFKKPKSSDGPIIWSGPVLAGDYLWVVGSNGKLVAVSPRDGTVEYERKVPERIYVTPVVAYGNIYLYSDKADLVMLIGENSASASKNSQPIGLIRGIKSLFGK